MMISILGNFGSISFDQKKPPVIALTISNEYDDETPVSVFALVMSNYNLMIHEHFDFINDEIAEDIMRGFTALLHYGMRVKEDITIDLSFLIKEICRRHEKLKEKSTEKTEKTEKEKVVHVDFSSKKKTD